MPASDDGPMIGVYRQSPAMDVALPHTSLLQDFAKKAVDQLRCRFEQVRPHMIPIEVSYRRENGVKFYFGGCGTTLTVSYIKFYY